LESRRSQASRARRQLPVQQAIEREFSAACDHECESERDGEKVVFKALAFLLAKPVHEKTNLQMNHENRAEHHGKNSECCDARQQADDQSEAAEKLREDYQRSDRR